MASQKSKSPGKYTAAVGAEETYVDVGKAGKGAAAEDDLKRYATGWHLFLQQIHALMVKNLLLAWRNRAATVLQLFSSFFFIFLLFALERAVKTFDNAASFKNGGTAKNPKPIYMAPIPPCNSGYFMKPDCYDFVWSGNKSATIKSLVRNITLNNPGRVIDFETQTLGFATPEDVDKWLLANPYMAPGALLFGFKESGALGYGLQTNSTSRVQREVYEDPVMKFQVPLMNAAERELAKYNAKDWSIEWNPALVSYAYPDTVPQNLVAFSQVVFLFAAACFNFVVQMGNLLAEKELKLRQAMNTMGLMDSVHWITWTMWEAGMAAISVLLLIAFGCMFHISLFIQNSFFVTFPFFFLFWMSMTSLAFVFSSILHKSSSANAIGFFIFVIGGCLQLLVTFRFPFLPISGFPYDKRFATVWQVLFSMFPPDMMAMGLKFLQDATVAPEDPGYTWGDITSCAPNNDECVLTMAGIYAWLLGSYVVYMLIAMYLDKVLPDTNGQRLHPLFFFQPSFWNPKYHTPEEISNIGAGTGAASSAAVAPAPHSPMISSFTTPMDSPPLTPGQPRDQKRSRRAERGGVDPDVAEEERRVKAAAAQGPGKEGPVALSVRGLVKTVKTKKGPFNAVDAPWYEVEKETLLCLLGPNGAGKSTTINCLTGVISATAGDALIYGQSIRSASAMVGIRRTMGVCPQFDVLWDALTGIEHLYLFARIKGLKRQYIPTEVTNLLAEVRLTEAGTVRSRSYSGGMRRRLSVAVALIGNPSIVFLDEPTTGMDPVSRRYVWDIIERAKRGRAIVLTTHSMEEADILGDRIAIMAKGRLRCIGTSIRLKERFGSGIIVTVSTPAFLRSFGSSQALAAPEIAHAAIKTFFRERLSIDPEKEDKGWIRYCIPNGSTRKSDKNGMAPSLADFFRDLSKNQDQLGITGLQLSLTTLEEVFLHIARVAELESAVAEKKYKSILLPSGVIVQVPVGADKVHFDSPAVSAPSTVPASPLLMDVDWKLDNQGKLVVAQHSEPVMAPAEVPPADHYEAKLDPKAEPSYTWNCSFSFRFNI